jgi:hypothetical protein
MRPWALGGIDMKKSFQYITICCALIFAAMGFYQNIIETINQRSGRFFLPKETVFAQLICIFSGILFAVFLLLKNNKKPLPVWLKHFGQASTKETQRRAAAVIVFLIGSSYFVDGVPKNLILPINNLIFGFIANLLFGGLSVIMGLTVTLCFFVKEE